jgi:DNA-binding PadR family transcriptional regulator
VPERNQAAEKISVFKGKQAALNLAIFGALSKTPLVIYDITKQVKEKREFYRLKPSIVGRRVRDLVNQGYLEIAGSRDTQPGIQATLYQLTTKAKVALYYNSVSRDKFLEEADEQTLAAELNILMLFFERRDSENLTV